MSILINLLPDTRQAKLRERRRRQLATGISVLVWAVCGGLVVALLLYEAGQKVIISNNNRNIEKKKADLKNTTGLIDALTAQQHSVSLPGLYAKRVFLSKFFNSYTEANPNEVTVTSLTIDAQNAMTVNGSANTYAAVAKLARALEASNVKVGTGAGETNSPYFTNIDISSVSSSNANGIGFTLNATLASGVTDGQK